MSKFNSLIRKTVYIILPCFSSLMMFILLLILSDQAKVSAQPPTQESPTITSTYYLPVIFYEYSPPEWEYIGLAGNVTDIFIDSHNPTHIYVSVYLEGLFETNDNGNTWIQHEQFTLTTRINDIESSPFLSGTMYLGTWGGYALYQSENGNVPWKPISGWIHLYPTLLSVAVHPISPSVMFAGSGNWETSGGQIYKSEDNGGNWFPTSPEFTNALTFAFDPISPTIVYAGTQHGRVKKSTDGGNSWFSSSIGIPIDAYYVTSIVAHPKHPKWLFAATSRGVYASYDGAENWQSLWEGIDTNTILVDPIRENTLYLGTEDGIYLSHDLGFTWARLGECGVGVPINRLGLDIDGNLLAGTGDGLFNGVGLWRCIIN